MSIYSDKFADLMKQVYLSYAKNDANWASKLKKHIALIEKKGIKIFDIHSIEPGNEIQRQIDKNLNLSDVFIILFSADYLLDSNSSDEFAGIMNLTRENKATLLWIIARTGPFKDTDLIEYQPINEKPLNSLTEAEQDQIFQKLYDHLTHSVKFNVIMRSGRKRSLGDIRAEEDRVMLDQAFYEGRDYKMLVGSAERIVVVGRRGTGKRLVTRWLTRRSYGFAHLG